MPSNLKPVMREPAALEDRAAADSRVGLASLKDRAWQYVRSHRPFSLVVLLPTLLAAVYYTFIAAPIYQAEAQFVVRSAASQTVTAGLTSMIQGFGVTNSSSDSYSVAAYLLSRDALGELEKTVQIHDIYARPEADFMRRFPNLIFGPSFENLFMHYQAWTTVDYDSSSGVSTLLVSAFRAQDAQRVANKLLDLSEKLVNRLNERARNDSLAAARHEVEHLQQQGIDVQKEVTEFRARELMLDPNASSTASLTRLAAVETDLASTKSLLAEVEKTVPQSPQIPGLRTRIHALEQQAKAEERRGSGDENSLAPKMAEYERLLLKQQFVQQMLQIAVTSLESAEVTMQQQQLYIERIAEPNLQDRALYPQRIIDTLVVAITCLIIYGLGRLIYVTVIEHQG